MIALFSERLTLRQNSTTPNTCLFSLFYFLYCFYRPIFYLDRPCRFSIQRTFIIFISPEIGDQPFDQLREI